MSDSVLNRVKILVANQLGAEESEIAENSHLQDDLNADPLSIADLIVRLENEFEVKIPQEQIAHFYTIQDISNYIEDKIGEI